MSRSPLTKRTKVTPRPLAPQNRKAGAHALRPHGENKERRSQALPPRQCKRVHKSFLSIAPIGNDTRAPLSRPGVSPQFLTERELPCTPAGGKPFIVLSGSPRRNRPSPQHPETPKHHPSAPQHHPARRGAAKALRQGAPQRDVAKNLHRRFADRGGQRAVLRPTRVALCRCLV